jgi:hypothetical protein
MDGLQTQNVHRMLHNASDWFAIKKERLKVMPKQFMRVILKQN